MIMPGRRMTIAMRPVDFRRGHDGLAATLQNELGLAPHSGPTVVLRSKRGDRLKLLVWDGFGLALVSKRLESGFFPWPKAQGWGDAARSGAVRSPVRGARLAARHGPAGEASDGRERIAPSCFHWICVSGMGEAAPMSSRLDPSLVNQPPPALRTALEARLEAALKAEAELRRHLEAQNADPREHDDRLGHLVQKV